MLSKSHSALGLRLQLVDKIFSRYLEFQHTTLVFEHYMPSATYKDAGVDLDTYREAMSRLPPLMHRTFSPRVMKLDGGFAGLFQLDFANHLFARNYQQPVLVAGTDGVGTKLKVAQLAGKHDTVGIDLVAMCVNDIICCGAETLFFLDYIAMPKDDPNVLEKMVEGVSAGCVEADCALLGGETAIMPDLYAPGEYDMAGFAVGVVERKQLIDGSAIAADDILIGVASNGLHSNGYSLVRKTVFDIAGMDLDDHVDELGESLRDILLKPTQIYARPLRRILNYYKVKHVVHGIAHITGGGLQENLERILPADVRITIEPNSWNISPVFSWLQKLGDVDHEEMSRVFNMGIGLVLVVSPFYADNICRMLNEEGLECWRIGSVS